MSQFFSMGSGDRWYLLVITFFSVVAFMPWARTVEVGGMASPAIALVQLFIRRKRGENNGP